MYCLFMDFPEDGKLKIEKISTIFSDKTQVSMLGIDGKLQVNGFECKVIVTI